MNGRSWALTRAAMVRAAETRIAETRGANADLILSNTCRKRNAGLPFLCQRASDAHEAEVGNYPRAAR